MKPDPGSNREVGDGYRYVALGITFGLGIVLFVGITLLVFVSKLLIPTYIEIFDVMRLRLSPLTLAVLFVVAFMMVSRFLFAPHPCQPHGPCPSP